MTLKSSMLTAVPGLAMMVVCPQCGLHARTYFMVIHLNDAHEMSREHIADWLEGLDVDLSFPAPEEAS